MIEVCLWIALAHSCVVVWCPAGVLLCRSSITVEENPSTSNEAEYIGMIEGLQAALKQGMKRLLVKGDSELVIRHMQGSYAVRALNLQHLFKHAKALERRFTKIDFTHIDR